MFLDNFPKPCNLQKIINIICLLDNSTNPFLYPAMASSRKRAASPPSRNEELKSPLAILLLKRWSTGDIPAVMVQEVASAAVMSGCNAPDVIAMKGLGCDGLQPGTLD